jgi:hypothetical protein
MSANVLPTISLSLLPRETQIPEPFPSCHRGGLVSVLQGTGLVA